MDDLMHENRIALQALDLDQVVSARSTIDNADFGLCELCAKPIPLARLKQRPAAAHCVPCAEVARV